MIRILDLGHLISYCYLYLMQMANHLLLLAAFISVVCGLYSKLFEQVGRALLLDLPYEGYHRGYVVFFATSL